jgi:hypothetical protein
MLDRAGTGSVSSDEIDAEGGATTTAAEDLVAVAIVAAAAAAVVVVAAMSTLSGSADNDTSRLCE